MCIFLTLFYSLVDTQKDCYCYSHLLNCLRSENVICVNRPRNKRIYALCAAVCCYYSFDSVLLSFFVAYLLAILQRICDRVVLYWWNKRYKHCTIDYKLIHVLPWSYVIITAIRICCTLHDLRWIFSFACQFTVLSVCIHRTGKCFSYIFKLNFHI